MYHDGELLIHERAGVGEQAARIGRSIANEMPPVAARFLDEHHFTVLSISDAEGFPHALACDSPKGTRAVDSRHVMLDLSEFPQPFPLHVESGRAVGMLAIDFATRRRMRINGRIVAMHADRYALLSLDQVYSNCQKHIRPRVRQEAPAGGIGAPAFSHVQEQNALRIIGEADTFFAATAHPQAGNDASHRGGPAGFVQVSGDVLHFPDYQGNMMFQTLGNLIVESRVELLFVDFVSRATLHVRGTATVHLDASADQTRAVSVSVQQTALIVPGLRASYEIDMPPGSPQRGRGSDA